MAGLISSAGGVLGGALSNTALGPVGSIVSGVTQTVGLVQQAGPGVVVYTVSAEVNGVLTQVPVVGAPAACLFHNVVGTLTLITGQGSTVLEPIIGSITAGGTNVIPVVIASATGAMSADPTAVLGSLAAATGALAGFTGSAADIASLLTCLSPGATGVPTGGISGIPTGGVSVPTGATVRTSLPTAGLSTPAGAPSTGPVETVSKSTGIGGVGGGGATTSVSMPKFTNAAVVGVVANNQLMGFMTIITAFVSLMFGSGFLFMMV